MRRGGLARRSLLAPGVVFAAWTALGHAQPASADGVDALDLAEVIASVSRDLGFDVDPSDSIRAAGLPAPLAARLAATLRALLDCHRATAGAVDGVSPAAMAAAVSGAIEGGPDPGQFAGVAACFAPLRQAVDDLELQLAAAAAGADPPVSLDVWPVVRVETGNADDIYLHDYVLLVDAGGNDTYDNNAGSNMIDLRWGPAPPAPNVGRAQGCQTALQDFRAGKCSVAAAVLLDLSGDDTYGVFEAPDPAVDAQCTADSVVRRSVTGGVGVAGAGILRDVTGNDRYAGKTGALGAGHIFGIGLLSDGAGNDSYLAVRNSLGFALLGGFGVLHDEAGHDTYDFYIPTPLNPEAANQTLGAGGVINDVGRCDHLPRFIQGAANLGQGLGALLDDEGDDSYRGSFIPTFEASIPLAGGVPAGSQGFGANGATGIFVDGSGADTYVGVAERGDGVTVPPGETSSGTGLFIDR